MYEWQKVNGVLSFKEKNMYKIVSNSSVYCSLPDRGLHVHTRSAALGSEH
jgi:hypothetical protein